MAGFVEGVDRAQSTLFPALLDDYVSEDNPVRAVDVFVDGLDLDKLGFVGVQSLDTGRPGYHPGMMLKLYIYGYLNRVPSSRRLERECQRNIEMIWLTGQLAPDFKTIADFRKDNGKAICEVCREFVALCRKLDLLVAASVAIDGSKFKAVNARDKNFTEAKMKRRLERIDESIARYLSQLETADRHGDAVPEAKVERLKGKIEKLKEETVRLNAINAEMMKSEDKQISLTDPDARSMATSGKDTGIVGYNVQIAVDTQHHLIVAHEVTNVGTDRHQLANMAGRARDEMAVETLEAVADRGYYDGEEIKACEEADITVTLPKPMTSGAKAAGRFGKQDFVYVAADDVYRCPAGERLTYHYTNIEGRKDTAPLLDKRLQNLRAKSSVHDRPRAPHLTLGARSCSGESSESARPQPQCNGCPPSDSGASVRHNEVLDGSNTLSHEKSAKGGHRDGAQRPRLQYEARDDDRGRGRIAGGDAGVRPAL
ncbi:transposase [Bradyrhizobium elkanii]